MPVAPETDPLRPDRSQIGPRRAQAKAKRQESSMVDLRQAPPTDGSDAIADDVVDIRTNVSADAPAAQSKSATAGPGPTSLGAAFAERARARRERRIAFDREEKQRRLAELADESDERDPDPTGTARSATDEPPTPSAAPAPPPPADGEPDAREKQSVLSTIVSLITLIGLLVAMYIALNAWQVWGTAESEKSDPPPAAGSVSAIVVMGAAQYDGTPSAVLEARLERALELFEADVAPVIIPTGSNLEGDRFTEGFTGFTWLRDRGVPEEAILIDVDGGNTYEQMTSTAAILGDRGFDSAVLVSDPYHSYRLKQIADEVGIEATIAATDTEATISDLARETVAVSVGRVIGFRRLSNLRE